MKHCILLLIIAFTSAPLMAADSLTIYSGRSDKLIAPVIKEFTEKTGIKVTLHSGKSAAMLSKLKLEGKRTTADLFLSNDAGTLETGRQLGLFQALDKATAEKIPANYRAPDNHWIGLSARARVLVINQNKLKPEELKSVFDLAKPEYRGKIGITHATNGSFVAGVTVYTEKKGKKAVTNWLKGLKNNAGGHVYNKHRAIVKDVASGKLSAGLVNHYYIFRHLDKDPNAPVQIIMPDQGNNGMGIAWNVSGIAWVKQSNKQAEVKKLIEFLTSNDGQHMFAQLNREYPVKPGVKTDEMLPASDSIKVADVPMTTLGQHRSRSIDIIEAVGMR